MDFRMKRKYVAGRGENGAKRFMRGKNGETEIETDRRIIRDRITLLKEKLKVVDKQRDIS